jgi:RNA polymerase sigma factor FliA
MMQGARDYEEIERDDCDMVNFVTTHSAFVKRIAYHVKSRLPAHIELDDLIQAGLVGLLEARKKFSLEYGVLFETYASIKVRGAMIDDFRKNSGMTREVSQNIKKISKARSKLENAKADNQVISNEDIAKALGIDIEKYSDLMREINLHQATTVDIYDENYEIASESELNPLTQIETENKNLYLKELIASFPKREQFILALYYNEQLTFKEIADIMGLTEARISQLHCSLLIKIKERWLHLESD